MDAFLLKKFGCPNALPRTGDLDQDAFARDALLSIQRDELAGRGDSIRGIEAQSGSDLRGKAWNRGTVTTLLPSLFASASLMLAHGDAAPPALPTGFPLLEGNRMRDGALLQ